MARNYTILGQQRVSYSEAIRQITGWNKKQFETQKRLMRYRVAKFNAFTGSNLSPIEQLFYKVRFEARREYYVAKGYQPMQLNDLQQALQDLKASPFTRKQKLEIENGKFKPQAMSKADLKALEISKNYIKERYAGLASNFPKANEIRNKLINDEITPAEANRLLADYAEEMRNLKDENPMKWIKAHGDEEIGSP